MINGILKLFHSHPVYHLFSGSIKVLENKYILNLKNEIHHVNFDDVVKVEMKIPNVVSRGHLQINFKKHEKLNVAFLIFENKNYDKMKKLFEEMKKRHQK